MIQQPTLNIRTAKNFSHTRYTTKTSYSNTGSFHVSSVGNKHVSEPYSRIDLNAEVSNYFNLHGTWLPCHQGISHHTTFGTSIRKNIMTSSEPNESIFLQSCRPQRPLRSKAYADTGVACSCGAKKTHLRRTHVVNYFHLTAKLSRHGIRNPVHSLCNH